MIKIHCTTCSTRTHKNAFVTDHDIPTENVFDLAEAERARWKIENENNNTLKTKGDHFEHNFGHGKQHLSSLLASMNILAFVVHTPLDLGDKTYRLIRDRLVQRKMRMAVENSSFLVRGKIFTTNHGIHRTHGRRWLPPAALEEVRVTAEGDGHWE